jgi:mono/diheme cytochrome c family protein/rhodanese-related sulfurtransferase
MIVRAARYFCILLCLGTIGVSQSLYASGSADLVPIRTLTKEQSNKATANYKKYCVMCHGENREGHVADHAPSLRAKSLFESGVPHAILRPLSYGREGTAMGGYLDEIGGPMTLDETWDLTYWLFEQSHAKRVPLTLDAVHGDVTRGAEIYDQKCSRCHGKEGEGITAPALGNPSALAHNSDAFIRYAIQNGRDGSEMVAFKKQLSAVDIDNVTAYLRSRASGWTDQKPVLQALPTPDQYVINPSGEDPTFTLDNELYVSSEALFKALQDKKKLIVFDTRVTSVWQVAHIEGSFPLPYYSDFDKLKAVLPQDVMIVAYCSCPRAAAEHVIGWLRDNGYKKTAVLYEGFFGWMKLGYPVTRRDVIDNKAVDQSAKK